MKKRFKNILIKRGKKNGISILICAVILTISLGTLVGCSIAKADTGEVSGQTGNEEAGEVSGQAEDEDIQFEQMSANNPSADNNTLEDTTIFTFSKEGETEQKQASLVTGDGYFFYLPDDEWQKSDSDLWTAEINEQVRFWITHFEDTTINEREEELADNGYGIESNEMAKQEGDIIYKVRLNEFGGDVWGVFYSYPADSEEGWGRELPVIADTFAVSALANGGQS